MLLCLLLLSYALYLPGILEASMKYSLFVRGLTSAVLIGLTGFLMGFPFPVAIRRLGQIEKDLIPWAYCANGSASVIAASLAVLIALEWGFRATMIVAIGFYFLAALLATGHERLTQLQAAVTAFKPEPQKEN